MEITKPFVCRYRLAHCGESEKNMRVTIGCFVDVCQRRCLKVNEDRSKVMALRGVERLTLAKRLRVESSWSII